MHIVASNGSVRTLLKNACLGKPRRTHILCGGASCGCLNRNTKQPGYYVSGLLCLLLRLFKLDYVSVKDNKYLHLIVPAG